MKRSLKWFVGAIVVGAIGSGLWSVVFAPVGSFLIKTFLSVGTLGIAAAKDSIYRQAAFGFTGDKPGIVVAEIPARPHKKWCELRKIVFSWTHAKFPFRVRSGRKLKIIVEPRIVTVTGKAFFDIPTLPQIDQTGEPIFPVMLHGKFIRL